MIRINRVRVEIKTKDGLYGIDEVFANGLNFIASSTNTCGKSSIIAAIYYCLGLEQILGGIGEKVLTSVYKTAIEDINGSHTVLESCAYLEISNGIETITIYRSAKLDGRDSKLISVFFSPYDKISDKETNLEDMYVHMPNSATNCKGFHAFLEKFLFLDLPEVPTSDDSERKLYLQLIFSAMFIEQKHGWSDIFSGMPILGIKEAGKRVVEFLLDLDTLGNDKKRATMKAQELSIKEKWENTIREIENESNRNNFVVIGVPRSPRILDEKELLRIKIELYGSEHISVDDWIRKLQEQYKKIKSYTPKIINNFDELQKELIETESDIRNVENELNQVASRIAIEEASIKSLSESLEMVKDDLSNNKDAARLKKLGSDIGLQAALNICPVCNQAVTDSLLPSIDNLKIMSIDENIRHLEAQKNMLEFALDGRRANREELKKVESQYESTLFTLRRLAKSLRTDLYATDEDLSETLVLKRLQLESQINDISKMQSDIEKYLKGLLELSEEWKEYIHDRENLPKKRFTDKDETKLKALQASFIKNLQSYGYKSIPDWSKVAISFDTYLPEYEGFDMKFDSSASDNIRAIWAFTIGLLQISLAFDGNHPTVIIFDEPDQQSVIPISMDELFKSILSMGEQCQVIIGVTVRDVDTQKVIENIEKDKVKVIPIPERAFRKYPEADQIKVTKH